MLLRPVTRDTFDACLDLRVAPGQEGFVAPTVRSLAETYVWPAAEPRLICHGDVPVGFVLFHPADDDWPVPGEVIVRFLVDARHQGRGLGRRGLRAALDRVARETAAATVSLSVVPANTAARRLYESEGFTATGHERGGEVVLARPVQRRSTT